MTLLKHNTTTLLKNFTFIGEFVALTESVRNLITLNVDKSVDKKIMSSKRGRIYVFVEEEKSGESEILKIGSSAAKSGLKGTLDCYTSALSGTPGQNRFCMHYLIHEKLNSGKKIKIYAKFVESVKTKITGLSSEIETEVPLDITYIEKICLDDYKATHGTLPIWNFQESGKKLPSNLKENFGNFIANIPKTTNKRVKKS